MEAAQMTDNLVAEALKLGDERAFEMIFRDWYTPLCRYAHTYLGDSDESEEVVQSVFVHLWEKRMDIAVEVSVRAYTYRSVRNACLNQLKHHKVRRMHSDHVLHTADTSMDGHISETGELERRIALALEALPAQCRQVFELSRFGELRYAEIAEKLNISVKTVENHMGKALRIMREQLQDYLPVLLLLLAMYE